MQVTSDLLPAVSDSSRPGLASCSRWSGRRGSTVGTGGKSSGMLAGDLPEPHIFTAVVTIFLGEPNVVTVAVSLPGDLSVLLTSPPRENHSRLTTVQ